MAGKIRHWLEDLELGQYAEAFELNEIGLQHLVDLSDEDLRELGVTAMGHRKTLLRAIAAMSGDEAPELAAVTPTGSIRPVARAERRQLTVLFCDLVGSTELSARLDPEDMRDLLHDYQAACSGVIARYEGFVAKLMGDGVYAYFGYPNAHEDEAERAVIAGLEIVEAVDQLKHGLSVRVGVATGPVAVGDIIGEGASEEVNVVGEAPNLAARLQEIAEPNTVVIAEATVALAGGMFDIKDLGRREFKGFPEPMGAWAVRGARRMASRFEATRGEQLTELVGRAEEMEILLRRWQRAKAGEGQTVLISGEPGIGKSRLVRECQVHVAQEDHFRMRHQCSPYHTGSALYPVIERLERAAGFEQHDKSDEKLAKLEAMIEPTDRPGDEVAMLLASLLAIPTSDSYPQLNVSPQKRKELTLECLVSQLRSLATRAPVLFVLEDAHWIDPTTLELLDLLVESVTTSAVLMLITFRPDFVAPWIGRPRVTPMLLGRLERMDSARIVAHLADRGSLPTDLLERITDQTDGIPLFVEELTKSVLELASDPSDGSALRVPATLQDSLAARLDRLGPAKEVAQLGSIVGRQFSYELLASVADLEPATLDEALDRLVDSGLVIRRGIGRDASYTFKHALVEGTAYGSLLRSQRAELHRRVAETLEHLQSDIGEVAPEILAHHYTEAGLVGPALDHWYLAGKRAMQRSANLEAEEHIRKGLKILGEIPESPERRGREIALYNTLGVCMMPTRGFGNPDVAEAFSRAAEVSSKENDDRGLFVALRGKGQYQMISGDLVTARDQSETILGLAEALDDTELLIEAHHLRYGSLSFTGEFKAARAHAEAVIGLYDREQHHQLTYIYSGHDPGVCSQSFGALPLWHLGLPDRALARCLEGKALADDLGHPFTIVVALWAMGLMRVLRREFEATLETGEALIRDCTEMGIRPFIPLGQILVGGARAEMGQIADGLKEMREGIAGMRRVKTEYTLTVFYAWLADLCLKAGRLDDAAHALQEGLAVSDANAERFCLPEFYRIQGELLSARSEADVADESLTRALSIAKQLGSNSLELRCSTSLARFWSDQGKTDQARDLLAPIRTGLTEGFDTRDFKSAKALLDQLQ